RQFLAQAFGGVGLGEQLRLEVQARRQVEVGMRGPGEAIHAAVLAAAVGIDRLAEADVGRLVAADDATRALLADLGAQRRARFAVVVEGVGIDRAPAVVLAAGQPLLEGPGHARGRAAGLDRGGRGAGG